MNDDRFHTIDVDRGCVLVLAQIVMALLLIGTCLALIGLHTVWSAL